MPIYERDPWRAQYFENVRCPHNVVIATDDIDAWPWHPKFNWVYDKLKVAQSQGFACGPHGVEPPRYPVFSKPITNLKGMGIGSRVIANSCDMDAHATAGHFWMELFAGAHVSTDCAVVNGTVMWLRHAEGIPAKQGTFSSWTLKRDKDPVLARYISNWVASHMAGYTGMMNFESIGGKIIEAHLRFADQWCDLNGQGWIDAVVRLYDKGVWEYTDDHRREGFSIPLFIEHGSNFLHPPEDLQESIRAMPDISSLQITFYENRNPEHHPMPPGGFRVAIINAWDFKAGLRAIDRLAKCFAEQRPRHKDHAAIAELNALKH